MEGDRPSVHTELEGARPAPEVGFLLHGRRRLPIGPEGLTIGGGEEADLALPGQGLSRIHARVAQEPGGGFTVEDLGSRHGTTVGGRRLQAEKHALRSGDAIEVDGEIVRFLIGDKTRVASRELPVMQTQVVRLEGGRITIGRDPANDIVLADPNVSRFHAEVLVRGDEAELVDLASTNGTRLDGHVIERARIGPGSEIGIGSFALVFEAGTMVARDERGWLRLDSSEVVVLVKGQQILAPTSLSIDPGELVAIIGESGSGKTTLVKTLAGVMQPSSGSILVNGEPVSSRLTDIGYVPQDDIVHPYLTVREALGYAARLRLPEDTSEQEAASAIDWALAELGLEEHAGKMIGSLSGGQRKRTSAASELLSRPSLLFLDEPTSGLDPGLETRMMELLRGLADDSRAVIVVTHATKNLRKCDKVAVMGQGGELAYFGTPQDALEFFGVEDFDGIYTALVTRPASEWRSLYELQRGDIDGDGGLPARGPAGGMASGTAPASRSRARRGRRLLPQVALLTKRYAKLMGRDRRNLLLLLGQIPILALLDAFLFKSGIFDRPGGSPADAIQLLYLLVIVAIWLGSIDSAREIVKESSVFRRESAIGVRLSAYLASKAIILFALVAVQVIGLVGIVMLLRPLDAPASTYLELLVLLTVVGFIGVAMGLAISAGVNTEDQAMSFNPLALIPQLLLAGAIVPLIQMSAPIELLSRVMFAQWALAASGTSLDMNGRMAEDPQHIAAERFGFDFFDVSMLTGTLVLLGFMALFIAITARLLRGRLKH